jgi:hypothetical protein
MYGLTWPTYERDPDLSTLLRLEFTTIQVHRVRVAQEQVLAHAKGRNSKPYSISITIVLVGLCGQLTSKDSSSLTNQEPVR